MAALTIRNLPDDIHRGLKALAVRHGRSTEAEVREILSAAVQPEGRVRLGQALAAIWRQDGGLSDQEATAIETALDRAPAEPMRFD